MAAPVPMNALEDDSEEEFEDACEDIPSAEVMDLHTGIQDTKVTLKLFLNNRFKEAQKNTEPWSDKSMYHALGKATMMFLQAMLTFEKENIDAAIDAVKKSLAVCNKFRHKETYMESFRNLAQKINYDVYSDEEVHAELCYAECLLQRALLAFIQDENMVSFIKGAFKINTCYRTYKHCAKILRSRQWSANAQKEHFESGVKIGIGAFNLLISQLPSRVLKLLEFVGFSGNKYLGLAELKAGNDCPAGLRAPLCTLVLLGYHTFVSYILGTGEGDLEFAERILLPYLRDYPKSAIFLFFSGRVEVLKGNVDEAIQQLEASVASQREWRQFHHMCYWELMWCHALQCNWAQAQSYADKLVAESKWSKAVYTYQKAVFLSMQGPRDSFGQNAQVTNLLGSVPKLVQRIAGKSIPIEKFARKKADLYKAQGNRLILPAIEVIYVWNGFSMIRNNKRILAKMLSAIDDGYNDLENNKNLFEFYADNYCLVMLLKGSCLRHDQQLVQAEHCLRQVLLREKELVYDTYLVPWALMELGMLKIDLGHYEEAAEVLDRAKSSTTKYALTAQLHFKVHAGQTKLKHLTGLREEEQDIPE